MLAVWMTALGASLCAQTDGFGVPDIDSGQIRTHLEYLADDRLEGRGTGTPGFQLAADYVAAQFRRVGLEPAFRGDFFQPLNLRHAEVMLNETSLVVRRDRRERRLSFGVDFVSSGDIYRPVVSIVAPVVFVGDGVSAPSIGRDDYAEVNARGKIAALVLRAIPGLTPTESAYFGSLDRRIEAAVAHGAIGLLLLSVDEAFPWARNLQLSSQGLTSVVGPSGTPLEPSRPMASAVLRYNASRELFAMASMDFDGLLSRHRNSPLPSTELPITVSARIRSKHSRLSSMNVAAVLPGSDPRLRREFVLFTAHLDHVGRGRAVEGDDIYNGAIDNASGVAALLAMAQAAAGRPVSPPRSLMFLATAGEEIGMLGAKFFTASPAVPLRDIVAAVNVDGPTLMMTPVERVNAQGGLNSTLGLVAAEVAAQLKVGVRHTAVPTISDQGPFVLHGVPALWALADPETSRPGVDGPGLARRFMSEVYHSPKDDLHRAFDYSAAVSMAQFNLLVGLRVAEAPDRPRWNPGDLFGDAASTLNRGP